MIRTVVYFASYFYCSWVALRLLRDPRWSWTERVLFFGIVLIPLGKLFYFPLAGLASVKMSFLYFSLVSSILFCFMLIRGVDRRTLFPLLFLVPPLLSMLFFDTQLAPWFFAPDPLTDTGDGTPFLRLISCGLNVVLCSFCIQCFISNSEARIEAAGFYIEATLFATLVGCIIYYGLLSGNLTVADVEAVSNQVHFGGQLYRFNPGANVNEFGEIVGYALILLIWTRWGWARKLLTFCALIAPEFISLTRGAWVGLAAATIVLLAFSQGVTRRVVAALCFFSAIAMFIVGYASPFVFELLISRTTDVSQSPGAVGRFSSFNAAFSDLSESWLRMLFGFGWSSDIYSEAVGYGTGQLHDVPITWLFDTGIIGFSGFVVLFAVIFAHCIANLRERSVVPFALFTFLFVVSLFEHTYYHTQTWLILALIVGTTTVPPRPVQHLT